MNMKSSVWVLSLALTFQLGSPSMLFAQSINEGLISKAKILGAECPCTPFPFEPDPPCYDICAVNFVALAPENELEELLGVDKAFIADVGIFHAQVQAMQDTSEFNQKFEEFFAENMEINLRAAFENADENKLQEALLEIFGE